MEDETQILEINLISAQGLKIPAGNLRRIQTYAVAWVNPSSKLRTRVDPIGGENPTWNDKFLFRVSKDYISGETSAVSVEIFSVGYIKDFLIGTVRFLLSSCLKKSIRVSPSAIGTPAFNCVQIRRPSGRFQGILNIATAVYDSSDFAIMDKVSAVCFRDLMEKKENDSPRWKLSRRGSRQSLQSSGADSDDSTTSSSSSASTAMKENNSGGGGEKRSMEKSHSGSSLCGLMLQRRMIPFCPSDQNLQNWADSTE